MGMNTATTANLDRAFCKSCNVMFSVPEGWAIDWEAVVPRIAPAEFIKNRVPTARRYMQHECGNYLRGTTVKARYSDKIICNEKCQSATRPVCECSCSGENHGAA